MAADSAVIWVYAVAAGDPGAAADMIGVGGAPVRAIRAADLTAIVGDVGQPGFGEAALRRNLEDLDWLEQTARAHHAVIESVAKERPVVPMRLATVFASDAGVAGMLRERAGDLRRALSRISGRSEWGVKGYADLHARIPVPDDPAAGPGAAYLQRRRAQFTAHADARREAAASAQVIHAGLCRLAVSARLYPPQAPGLAGQPVPMVLNAAYLVADERSEEFTAAVTNLAGGHRSVQLALTGPWPAYSFAAEPDDAAERPPDGLT
jgi:hypothetical protein